jgi:hypothetical protein
VLALTGLALAFVVPLLAVVGLLLLTARVQRAREAVIARQVDVTDAIHRELGAVAAPVVRKRAWGRWQVQIAVDFERPALVTAVLAAAWTAVARFDPATSVRIVLVARDAPARVRAA